MAREPKLWGTSRKLKGGVRRLSWRVGRRVWFMLLLRPEGYWEVTTHPVRLAAGSAYPFIGPDYKPHWLVIGHDGSQREV